MKRMRLLGLACGVVVVCLVLGCGESQKPGGESNTGASRPVGDGHQAGDGHDHGSSESEQKSAEVSAGDWTGYWRIEMTEEGVIHDFGVVDVQSGTQEGSWSIKSLSLSPSYDAAVLTESSIDGDAIKLVYDGGPRLSFVFQGKKGEKEVKGNLTIKGLHVSPIRLIKVTTDILDGDPEGKPMEGFEEFTKVASSPDGEDGLRDYIEKYPDNPLVLRAYEVLAGFARSREASAEEVAKLHDEMMERSQQWGGLVSVRANFEFARFLTRIQFQLELAKRYLEEFEKSLSEESPEAWNLDLAIARISVGEHEQVIAQLRPLVEKNADDYPSRYILSMADEKKGDQGAALESLLKLASLPLMDQILDSQLKTSKTESLEKSVQRLWAAKHGGKEGLEQQLDETYLKQIEAIFPKNREKGAGTDKQATVLVELFTGTSCPPCVVADLAVGGIHQNYSDREAIVIRYHEHIPGPDPFAIDDGLHRFEYYIRKDPFYQQNPEQAGTPALFVNGVTVPGVGGALVSEVVAAYQTVVDQINPQLERKTDYKILLEAPRSGDSIKVSAKVEGPEAPESLRLHVLLIEDEIHHVASNGIRIHDGVVRQMISGKDGIAPQEKRLGFEGEVVVPEVIAKIKKSLGKMEEKSGRLFAVDPKLEKLQVVAFLQDDSTREVLQSAIVRVGSK